MDNKWKLDAEDKYFMGKLSGRFRKIEILSEIL